MKNLKLAAILLVSFAVISACGGGKKTAGTGSPSTSAAQLGKKVSSGPAWYFAEEDNENYLIVYSSAVSTRRETARQKAQTNAAAEMARKLSVKVEALQKSFSEEITSGSQTNYDEAFTNATKTIASEKLTGLSQYKIEFYEKDSGEIECFVAIRMPVGDAKARLENTLSKNQELWVKFKESKAFDELNADISRLGKAN